MTCKSRMEERGVSIDRTLYIAFMIDAIHFDSMQASITATQGKVREAYTRDLLSSRLHQS